MVETKLGEGRVEAAYPWKGLGPLALGTDAPVERLDPRWTFYCATTREGWRTSHCLSPAEALRGMTAGAAYAGFMDAGVLAPGRPADMAVLSHDWLEVPPREVLESQVLATLMDGRVGYQAREFRG
jgi:predicted amidohydrolase YtcJ